jgi:hypothetical protein
MCTANPAQSNAAVDDGQVLELKNNQPSTLFQGGREGGGGRARTKQKTRGRGEDREIWKENERGSNPGLRLSMQFVGCGSLLR